MTTATLHDVFRPVASDLAAVMEELHRQLHSARPLLGALFDHLRSAQGKYLRPALVLLSGHVGGRTTRPQLVTLGAAMELIHTAALLHDDVIDQAEMRRNLPSINAKWGTEISITLGDFLYGRAFTLLVSLGELRVLDAVARVTEAMSVAELLEVERRYDPRCTETDYLEVIEGKTASLMAACCELGGRLGGATEPETAALREFGLNVGMAFQIADDCLDLIGEADVLGKRIGTDLAKGHLSLPVILFLASCSAAERDAWVQRLKQDGCPPEALLADLAAHVQAQGGIEEAYRRAQEFVLRAKTQVMACQHLAAREPLAALAEYVVQRVS